MNLCLLETIKGLLAIDLYDLKDDVLLALYIEGIGERFQTELQRRLERAEGVTFEFRADEMDLLPDCYPIEAITTWHTKDNEVDGWEAVDAPEYLISPSKSRVELSTPLGTSRQLGSITYTGGYVLPGASAEAGQTALPKDLERAAVEQVLYCWKHKDRLGITSQSGAGGSIQQFASLDLLPSVKAVLKKYERWQNT